MGRLIDADSLREHWHISEKCEECHWNNRDCSKLPYYSLHDMCEAIDEAPTIDAIPVEWLKAQIAPYRGDVSDIGKGAHNATIKNLIYKWQHEQGAQDG